MQDPSTREYYLVFYYDIRSLLDRFIHIKNEYISYVQYSDFGEIKEIGSGGYETVYTAKYKNYQTVVLKWFKNFDETPELFISEVSNNWYDI